MDSDESTSSTVIPPPNSPISKPSIRNGVENDRFSSDLWERMKSWTSYERHQRLLYVHGLPSIFDHERIEFSDDDD